MSHLPDFIASRTRRRASSIPNVIISSCIVPRAGHRRRSPYHAAPAAPMTIRPAAATISDRDAPPPTVCSGAGSGGGGVDVGRGVPAPIVAVRPVTVGDAGRVGDDGAVAVAAGDATIAGVATAVVGVGGMGDGVGEGDSVAVAAGAAISIGSNWEGSRTTISALP